MDNEFLVAYSPDGILVSSSLVAKKLENTTLSPSTISGLESCPAKWLVSKFIVPHLSLPSPLPAERGSLFHRVMEKMFLLPPPERTVKMVRNLVDDVFIEEFPHLVSDLKTVQWVRNAVNGVYQMGIDMCGQVAELPGQNNTLVPGLEYFLRDVLPDTDVEILGLIDRVMLDGDTGRVSVEDWKTGLIKEFSKTSRWGEGWAEARQQILYTVLLEKQGFEVSSASLIFPLYNRTVNVPVFDQELRERAVKETIQAGDVLQGCIETNCFGFSPSALCAWCPLAKTCGAAKIGASQKMLDALASQPDKTLLGAKIDFNEGTLFNI